VSAAPSSDAASSDAAPAGELRLDDLRPRTGRGVRVVVVDSGVYAAHPHVGGVAGGVGIDADGSMHDDFVDRIGHGTAVTAVIREKAPEAEIWVAKVFDRELAASAAVLVAAIDWAVTRRAHMVNLSLGTTNPAHESLLRAAVDRAHRAGTWIVAAGEQDGVRWLPGTLDDVVSVTLDWTLSRDTCRIDPLWSGATAPHRARASGYPRPIPGVPPERNLKGVSFAVANVTGLLALAIEARAQ
jgi:subtilisin family serine protease